MLKNAHFFVPGGFALPTSRHQQQSKEGREFEFKLEWTAKLLIFKRLAKSIERAQTEKI